MNKPVDTDNTENYQWAAGCQAWILNQSPAASIKEELMGPGTREQLHLHKQMEQFFYILEGQAVLYVDGNTIPIQANQGLSVPAMTTHYIANESGAPVRFLVISAPAVQDDRENLS